MVSTPLEASVGLRRRRRGPAAFPVQWVFLAPALLAFGVFSFWPIVKGAYESFFKVRPYLGNQWIGTQNFERTLTDAVLHEAIRNTVLDMVVVVSVSLVLGLALAMLLEGTRRYLGWARAVVYLPAVAAVAIVAEVWRVLLYPSSSGLVNNMLDFVGIGPFQFFSSADQSLWSVMLMQIWITAPFNMAIFVAGLAGIDRQLYEAADVDGANPWQRFWNVTVPSLRGVIAVVVTLGLIRGMRVFTEVWALTGGGPGTSSETIVSYTYKTGLAGGHDLGYASAVSTLLFVATAVLTGVTRVMWRGRD